MADHDKTREEAGRYFADFRLDRGDAVGVEASYGAMMIGPGRWCVLAKDGTAHGIAWTDDGTNMGVTLAAGMDTAAHRRVLTGVRAMAAENVSTTEAFDYLVQLYQVETIYSGLLEDLYASL